MSALLCRPAIKGEPIPINHCVECGKFVKTVKRKSNGGKEAGEWAWSERCRRCSMRLAHQRRPGAWGTKPRKQAQIAG